MASSRLLPNYCIVHTFECPDLQDIQARIVRETISTYRADTVVHLPKLTPIDTAAKQLSQSPEDSLIGPTEDRLSQSLDSSRRQFCGHLVTRSPHGNGTCPTNESITDKN